jgi:hypothetical protein
VRSTLTSTQATCYILACMAVLDLELKTQMVSRVRSTLTTTRATCLTLACTAGLDLEPRTRVAYSVRATLAIIASLSLVRTTDVWKDSRASGESISSIVISRPSP